MTDKRPKWEIGIEDCFTVFAQSVNRLKYFSCIANHLTLEGLPLDWCIHKPSEISYRVKAPETQEDKQKILDGYKHFIHCYLVRDCIESFSVSLDNLFFVLLLNGKRILSTQTFRDILSEKEKTLLKRFEKASPFQEKKGIEGKIQLLETHFGLELTDDHKQILLGLRDIRNCLSHSNGLVRQTDGESDGKGGREFTWKTIHTFLKGDVSGREFNIEFNRPMPEAGPVCMRIKSHSKSFQVNQQLSFMPWEAYEIAFSLQQVGRALLQKTAEKMISSTKDVA